jgi:hypothetical protein
LYELGNELTANEGGSFLPKTKPGRIAGDAWMTERAPVATAVYNANYSATGEHIHWHENPWSVMGPGGFKTFSTHTEAIHWAFHEQPTPPDLGPQDQERVTAGWTPPHDHEAAWQEKWNLTR